LSRDQRNESPRPFISVFWAEAAIFPFKYLLNYPHEAEWTLFQTHYFSENLVAPEIEPGTSGSVARNSDHQTTEAVIIIIIVIIYCKWVFTRWQ
jgi:hypothetical protein